MRPEIRHFGVKSQMSNFYRSNLQRPMAVPFNLVMLRHNIGMVPMDNLVVGDHQHFAVNNRVFRRSNILSERCAEYVSV